MDLRGERYLGYSSYFGWLFDLLEEKHIFFVILQPKRGRCIPGKKNSSPAAGIFIVSAQSGADSIVFGFFNQESLYKTTRKQEA